MTPRAAQFLVLLALLPWPAASQTNPAIPHVDETIDVSIVNLDVIVTDKHGNRVTGLTRDDFELLEEGRSQAITNFSEYRSEQHAAVGASNVTATGQIVQPSAGPRLPRTIVIFVDNLKLDHLAIDPVFNGLKKLLREVVEPGDSVMIIGWAMHPVIRQPATDDLARVDAMLDKIASASIGARRDESGEMVDRVAEVYDYLKEAADFAASHGLKMAPPSVDDEALLAEPRSAAEIALYEMKEKIKSLNAIVTSMSGATGKKALFIVSHRLGFYAGGEYFFATREQIPELDRARYDTSALVKSLTNNANAHGVTIYTLFPEGLPMPELRFSNHVPGQDDVRGQYQTFNNEIRSLKWIADETGGTMAYSAVDIAKMLPRIRDDFDSYYSLAYRITARHDDRARSVTVRARNRDYRTRTRQHYFEASEQADMHDRVVANLLRKPETASSIPLDIILGSPVQKGKRVWSVPVEVRFPASALTTLPVAGASKGGFTVYVAAGRLFGSSADVTHQTVPFTAKPGSDAAKFNYRFDLLTDFVSDKLSVGILDEVSHEKGFATTNLPLKPVVR
jgi:VWFA-related protein